MLFVFKLIITGGAAHSSSQHIRYHHRSHTGLSSNCRPASSRVLVRPSQSQEWSGAAALVMRAGGVKSCRDTTNTWYPSPRPGWSPVHHQPTENISFYGDSLMVGRQFGLTTVKSFWLSFVELIPAMLAPWQGRPGRLVVMSRWTEQNISIITGEVSWRPLRAP